MKSENRQNKTGRGLVVLALALGWLAGCTTTNALEQDYGNAVHNNFAQTVVNPRAGQDTSLAVGMGPKSSVNNMERYDKSFKGEEKKTEMKVIAPY